LWQFGLEGGVPDSELARPLKSVVFQARTSKDSASSMPNNWAQFLLDLTNSLNFRIRENNQMKTVMTLLIASALALVGCASGAKFTDYAAKLPPPKQGDGRIWFFRPQKVLGAAVQPTVYLNGRAVGTAKPGGFFHVDRPAGQYEVKCKTEWSDSTTFTLAPQSTKYIRLLMVPGLLVGHVLPREDSPTDALEDLQTLHANSSLEPRRAQPQRSSTRQIPATRSASRALASPSPTPTPAQQREEEIQNPNVTPQ
jgi:hypothetical protein